MRKLLLGIAAAIIMLGLPATSMADFVLFIDDLSTGGIDIIVADNQGVGFVTDSGLVTTHADASGTLGVLLFAGSTPNFTVTITTGQSKPVLGGPDTALLDLTYTLTAGAAGAVEVWVTDTDYDIGGSGGQFAITQLVNGNFVGASTAGSELRFRSAYDPTNTEFGFPFPLPLHIFTPPPNGYSAEDTIEVTGVNPFSLLTAVRFSAISAGQGTTGDAQVKAVVPAPAGLILALTAFPVLGVYVRRRKARLAA